VAYGPSVDFVSVIVPTTNMPASGMKGDDEVDEIVTFGQSSAATGTYAGLLALASQYAKKEGWTREQLMAALKLASSRDNITDDSEKRVQAIVGVGILDAYRATGGARSVLLGSCPKLLDASLRTSQRSIYQKGVGVGGHLGCDPCGQSHKRGGQGLPEPEGPLETREGDLDLLANPGRLALAWSVTTTIPNSANSSSSSPLR